MKPMRVTWMLAAAFAGACALALARIGCPSRGSSTAPAARAPRPAVLWRTPMAAAPNAPCAFSGGWIVTDEKGGVAALSREGKPLWRVSFSNQVFAAAASVVAEWAVVASQDGAVAGLRLETGALAWRCELDGRFQHAPLTGLRSGTPVVWLVSQADGRLFCLRAADGALVWKSETTNRCDGSPARVGDRIVYGNCDGAVHVFDVADGAEKGAVKVGESDQMAGGVLPLTSGLLATGTRQGNLVVADARALALVAQTNVSPSEAFVTPAEAFGGLVAMGTAEGAVSFWKLSGTAMVSAGRAELGAPVDSLQAGDGHLYVLAGGSLCAFASARGAVERLSLGDAAKGLAISEDGRLACVADGAIVCVGEAKQ